MRARRVAVRWEQGIAVSDGNDPAQRTCKMLQRRWAGKVCIVTGSSAGIGREVARLLAAADAKVVINGRNGARLRSVATELHGLNEAVLPVVADISTLEGAKVLIDQTMSTYGRIDALINNAGTSMRGDIADLSTTTLDAMYAGNICAALFPTVSAVPQLIRTRGRITFVSTVSAATGFGGVAAYSASKAAVERFAEALAIELPQVTVRLVRLGFVQNDPDKQILSADGRRFRHRRAAKTTQIEAARAILSAATGAHFLTIADRSGRLLAIALRVAPRLVRRALRRRGSSLHSVTESV